MKQVKFRFRDKILLPKRRYNVELYKNYVDYVMQKKREDKFCCHCFAIFDEHLSHVIKELIKDKPEYCQCEDIIINSLEEENLC